MEESIYLDYNSTTPLDPEVVTSICESLRQDWANPSSDSALGRRAKQTIEAARSKVAAMVNAASPRHIVFTSGGTESNNMAIRSVVEWARRQRPSVTPHVVMSCVEHVATTAPIMQLVSTGAIHFDKCKVNKDGCLEVAELMALVRPATVLVTVMMANNETGVIFPVQQIARELKIMNKSRKDRVWLHVDAAQAIGKLRVDVQEMGVDYLTIVGHKFYGPRIGALYVRDSQVVSPVVHGGGQECGLRPGTENTPMIVGLGKAAELVTQNLDAYAAHMAETRDFLLQQLRSQVECVVNCEASDRLPNTASVAWPQWPLSGCALLDRCPKLVASTTAACHDQNVLSEVLLRSGVPSHLAKTTVRLSVGRDTSREHIDIAVTELVQAVGKADCIT